MKASGLALSRDHPKCLAGISHARLHYNTHRFTWDTFQSKRWADPVDRWVCNAGLVAPVAFAVTLNSRLAPTVARKILTVSAMPKINLSDGGQYAYLLVVEFRHPLYKVMISARHLLQLKQYNTVCSTCHLIFGLLTTCARQQHHWS